MTRLCRFRLCCFLLGALSAIAATTSAGDSHSRPNIIFVVADDMGFKDAGYTGNPIVKTPHLDRMAAEGLRIDNFYSAAGTCSPGRMAILTGRTPLRARMVTTVGPMQEGEVTVAAALKTAGYHTAHFGKWGLGRDGTHPLKVGFDEAVGKLREELRRLNIADNTLLWFVSDNGGISETSGIEKKGRIGARTIGLLEWPRKISKPGRTDVPVCHVDMYPTVLDIVGVTMEHQPVIDGLSLVPLFNGEMTSRPRPLGFTSGRYAENGDPESCQLLNAAWIDGRFMLRLDPPTKQRSSESVTLFDLSTDPDQEKDLADEHPQDVQRMLAELAAWRESVTTSFAGQDYIR